MLDLEVGEQGGGGDEVIGGTWKILASVLVVAQLILFGIKRHSKDLPVAISSTWFKSKVK